MHVGWPCARVLELWERADEGQLPADAAVDVGERRQAELGARVVELAPPALQAAPDRVLGAAPQRAPGGCAGHARAERVDRGVGKGVRVDVGYERGARPVVDLGGECGGERE